MSLTKRNIDKHSRNARPELNLCGGKRAVIFTRWSRKAYASFLSIHREVKIGTLRANVVERLLKKSGYKAAPHLQRRARFEHLKMCDDSDDPAAIFALLLLSACRGFGIGSNGPQLGCAYTCIEY